MPREFTRSDRVSDALQRELATLIRDHIRDPRVGMLSVTEVDVSRDLAVAKAYVAFVGERSQSQIDQGIKALNGAAGYLRKLLATSISLRTTPKLTFFHDHSGCRGQHLEALIDLAVSNPQAASDSSGES